MDLKPCTRIFIQFDGGYYSIPYDATTGLLILPGTGTGTLTHQGSTWTFTAADPAATTSDPKLPVWATPPIIKGFPTDDFSTLMQAADSGKLIVLEPGHYVGPHDFTVAADPAP